MGADKVWSNLISKYNTLTGQAVTTDLNAYVTTETINGVFKWWRKRKRYPKYSGIENNQYFAEGLWGTGRKIISFLI
ncbi:hypothetical protein [Chryseobacterium wanjuense]